MRVLRIIFALYMTWLLACFLPGHVRGQITMGPEQRGESASCCASHTPEKSDRQPTERDKRNCAVCHFAAGLQLYTPVAFEFALTDRLDETADTAVDRLVSPLLPRETLPRGPSSAHA